MSIPETRGRVRAGLLALCALIVSVPITLPAPAQAALNCTFTKSVDVYEDGVGKTGAAARTAANADFVKADAAARASLAQWAAATVCPASCGGKSSSIVAVPNPPAEVVAPPVLAGGSGPWKGGPFLYGARGVFVDGFMETLTDVVACRLAFKHWRERFMLPKPH